MQFLNFPSLPRLSIAVGATTPVPGDGAGSLAYSTTINNIVWWTGSSWSAGSSAPSPYTLQNYTNFAALPENLTAADFQLALVGNYELYYWTGYQWQRIGSIGVDSADSTQEFRGNYKKVSIGPLINGGDMVAIENNVGASQHPKAFSANTVARSVSEWVVTTTWTGLKSALTSLSGQGLLTATAKPRIGANGYDPEAPNPLMDADEAEMDQVFVTALCPSNNTLLLYCSAVPGPVHGDWDAHVVITPQ